MNERLGPESLASPSVTVVIPTFNGGGYLAETLQAVNAQTLQGVEVIVVDDGSTDNTLDVVAAVAPQAKVVRQSRAGVSSARNHGLRLAGSEFVIFLDQDDIWHPQMLALQQGWLSIHPDHAAVVCRYLHWHPDANGSHTAANAIWPAPTPGTDLDFTGWVYHQFLLDCWALTSGTLLRRQALMKVGGFDESLPYSEDWDLWLRLSPRWPFALLTWPPVLYRQHPVQGSRTPRARDYRVDLLVRHARLNGLASADGRSVARNHFLAQLARYKFEFGYHHLHGGQRWVGVRALLEAWWMNPWQTRPLLLVAAAVLGWRPVSRRA